MPVPATACSTFSGVPASDWKVATSEFGGVLPEIVLMFDWSCLSLKLATAIVEAPVKSVAEIRPVD